MHQNLECVKPKSWGRCTKCTPCQNWRRMQWIYRLKQEASISSRVWFLTLTSSTTMTQEQWTTSWQKYMKKLRKSLTAQNAEPISRRIRYFAVQELGTINSRRHLQSLMFFSDGLTPGRRELEKHWNHGYSSCKLVRPGHIRYVAKYIGKDTRRIHASQLLGLRLGTGTETNPHPMWYLNLRRKRLMTPIISLANTNNDLDTMERTIAPPKEGPPVQSTPRPQKQQKQPGPPGPHAANDECWVGEGRSPALEGEREAQHGEK